jgi:hypothetical protein
MKSVRWIPLLALMMNATSPPTHAANRPEAFSGPRLSSLTGEAEPFTAAVPDGNGGFYMLHGKTRSGSVDFEIGEVRVYRFDSSGEPVAGWPAGGVGVAEVGSGQYSPLMVSDGAGGVIIAWDDLRSGYLSTWAQRISAAGASVWDASGVALSSGNAYQYLAHLIADGSGGVIALWTDAGPDLAYNTSLRA